MLYFSLGHISKVQLWCFIKHFNLIFLKKQVLFGLLKIWLIVNYLIERRCLICFVFLYVCVCVCFRALPLFLQCLINHALWL